MSQAPPTECHRRHSLLFKSYDSISCDTQKHLLTLPFSPGFEEKGEVRGQSYRWNYHRLMYIQQDEISRLLVNSLTCHCERSEAIPFIIKSNILRLLRRLRSSQ